MIVKKENEKGLLITTPKDQLGRADSRLIVIISKVNRELKGNIVSLYHSEECYNKENKIIMTFNWADKDKVLYLTRLNGFEVVIE